METEAVLSDVECHAGINNGQGDGAVHHTSFNLFVVCLVDYHMVVPLVERWGAVAEVTVPLVMIVCANLIDLSVAVLVALDGVE